MALGETPIKRAMRWIDERLREDPRADRLMLIEAASKEFDLTPLDADFLFRHLADHGHPS